MHGKRQSFDDKPASGERHASARFAFTTPTPNSFNEKSRLLEPVELAIETGMYYM
jgi:hypothetical protein